MARCKGAGCWHLGRGWLSGGVQGGPEAEQHPGRVCVVFPLPVPHSPTKAPSLLLPPSFPPKVAALWPPASCCEAGLCQYGAQGAPQPHTTAACVTERPEQLVLSHRVARPSQELCGRRCHLPVSVEPRPLPPPPVSPRVWGAHLGTCPGSPQPSPSSPGNLS